MTDVEKEIRRKVGPKESRSSSLPETKELMRLFGTATQSKTQEKIEEKQTELQGKFKDVTIELKQQPAEIVELEKQESDRAPPPSIPTQTTQRPSKISIAPSTPSPIVNPPAPAPVLIPSAPMGCVTCLHCGKEFTQPIRILDFQGDTPRIIDICPFCNEIIAHPGTKKNRQKR